MVLFSRKTDVAGMLIATCFLIFFLFPACEQPGGAIRDDDATLRTLTVDRGRLRPAFSASRFNYSVTVRNVNDAITVTAAANSVKTLVNGAGTKPLNVGSGNIITVGVMSETGIINTYTITVTRHDGSVNTITSADDMAKIGIEDGWSLVGNYELANDISLEDWLPIGDKENPFTGVFEGNAKKITLNSFNTAALSQKTYLGIFGYVEGDTVSEKAEIKNLTVDSSINVMGTAQAIGLVTGYAGLAEIENITLTGSLDYTSTSTNYVGGIAGIAAGEGTLIKNSTSNLTTMHVVPGQSGSLVAGLINYSYVGGFVGMFTKGAGIENCHYTGDITADNTQSSVSGQVFVGGIAGGSYYGFGTAYNGHINGSSFNGNIIGRAKGDWTFAGGIAGTICGGNINNLAATTRIEHCFAIGKVSAAGTDSGNPYVGGIVGYNYYGALVSQSYFAGTVIANKSGDYTGGIAGYNSRATGSSSRIEDCWSSGTITGFNNAGGIVGQNQVTASIQRCYSRASVSATDRASTGIGGIVGLNGATEGAASVANCVALNNPLTAPAGNNIHRVIGYNSGKMSNNHAWSGMTITTGGTYTSDIGVNARDGADCVQKPDQAFYKGLGWDFDEIWKMGSDGYPILNWQ